MKPLFRHRWMNGGDLDYVAEIDAAASGELAMSKQDIRAFLTTSNKAVLRYGIVLEVHGAIVGFVLYSELRHSLLIDLLSVKCCQEWVREAQVYLLELMKTKAHSKQKMLNTWCVEDNLDLQLIFRSLGFRATAVERGMFGQNCDGYRFQCMISEGVPA